MRILVAFIVILLSIGVGLPATCDTEPRAVEDTYTQVQALIFKNYPKATFERKNGLFTARFNTRQFMIHHQLKTGEWQDARPQEGPDMNGIFCTIESSPGPFMGAAAVSAAPESAAAFDEHYFTSLMMVPFCKRLSRHLISHLDYPYGVSTKFLEEYRKTIAKFSNDR